MSASATWGGPWVDGSAILWCGEFIYLVVRKYLVMLLSRNKFWNEVVIHIGWKEIIYCLEDLFMERELG